MILKAGTYRFNDELEPYSIINDDNIDSIADFQFYLPISTITLDDGSHTENYGFIRIPCLKYSVTELGLDNNNLLFATNSTDETDILAYADGLWLHDGVFQTHTIEKDIDVPDTYGSWYVSNTNYNEVNAEDTIYTEKSSWYKSVADAIRNKKGTTDPILRDDFASEISSITGGGSGECSGNHIIEVDELPTENIDESAVYKVEKNNFNDLIAYLPEEGAISFVEAYRGYGFTFELYSVSTKPAENIASSNFDTGFMALYYVKNADEEDVFVHLADYGWLTFNDVFFEGGASYNGAITDISEATQVGYYALAEVGWSLNQYTDGAWSTYIVPSGATKIIANGTYDIANKETVDVNVPITLNGVIERYKVKAGATVSAGDFVEFLTQYGSGTFSSWGLSLAACKIDNERVLLAYADANDSSYCTGVVMKISNGKIAQGTKKRVGISYADMIDCVALANGKALVVSGTASSGKTQMMVLTISGTSISTGTNTTLSYKAHNSTLVALSESKAVVLNENCDNGYRSTAMVLSINGTTITQGTPTTIGEGTVTPYGVRLTENKLLMLYGHNAAVLTIDSMSITVGTATQLYEGSGSSCAVTISENKVLVIYNDATNSAYGTGVILTIDGTTITLGTPTVSGHNIKGGKVSALGENTYIVTYQDVNNGYGTAIVLTINGEIVTFGTPTTINNSYSYYNASVVLGSYAFFFASNSTAKVMAYWSLRIDDTTITVESGDYGTFVYPATSRANNVGVATTAGAEGETIPVYCVSIE